MVAISLYRGNLHRTPDIPRRWVMPRPGISLKDFRGLLRRRSKALSLLKADHGLASTSAPSAIGTGRNPPLPPPPSLPLLPPPVPVEEDVKAQARNSSSLVPVDVGSSERNANLEDGRVEDLALVALEELANLVSPVGGKVKVVEKESNALDLQVEMDKGKGEEGQEKKNGDPNSEGNQKLGATNEKEERKREVEEKLEILNKKKHNLVQALKQILSAEEELKRKSSMQQPTRPSLPLQVDVSNDSGSMTKVTTPKTGSEANVGGNTGGGEADDVLNHDLQSRHIPRMSSISPCAESALKRSSYFQHNTASNPSRSSALVSGSPLRFAVPGNQAQASNLPPPLSTSGTNYIVSSSSPAASVGTSTFKDARSASS